jgi:hypothetical protein
MLGLLKPLRELLQLVREQVPIADHERATGTTSASAPTETAKPAAAMTGWA